MLQYFGFHLLALCLYFAPLLGTIFLHWQAQLLAAEVGSGGCLPSPVQAPDRGLPMSVDLNNACAFCGLAKVIME